MKVKKICIENIGGIKNAELVFNDRMNIICGYNGVGKTTILNSLSHCFIGGVHTKILTRNVNSNNGKVDAVLCDRDFDDLDKEQTEISFKIEHFNPDENDHIYIPLELKELSVINLTIDRFIRYQKVVSISSDKDTSDFFWKTNIMEGVKVDNFKSWFLNRYLYSAHEGSLSDFQVENLNFAKECFSILDNDFSFKTVRAQDNEIIINTPTGDVFFEYLSSGFKSCLAILFCIIKEIEFFLKDKKKIAREFDGLILIDEPEMHLHPSWQYKIRSILMNTFKKAQFICASHSPYIVQSCDVHEVIALRNDKGSICKNKNLKNEMSGFQGWTIEEILDDVMGMPDVRTSLYKDKVKNFYDAIEREDVDAARESYNELDVMLHPNNMDRKIFSMDLSLLSGGEQ